MRSLLSKRTAIAAVVVLVAIFVITSLASCTPTDVGAHAFRDVRNGPAIARCIIHRESRGQAGVVGGPNRNGTYDYGLFQINSSHKALMEQKLGVSFYGHVKDPVWNARMARVLYDEAVRYWGPNAGWRPWGPGACGSAR